MSSIELNITYQDHCGPGDIVTGDKIVNMYQSIAPKRFKSLLNLFSLTSAKKIRTQPKFD